jgi:hypothetical protein
MRKMKEFATGTWLVWDEPLPMGQSPASGAAVFQWRSGNWTCDECGAGGGFPPAGSTEQPCDHINFVKSRRT